MLINHYRYNKLFQLASIFALTIGAVQLTANDRLDHLVPSNGIIKPDYENLLRRKLYLTPADYIRIAVLPSTGSLGETVYSLHSAGKNVDQVTLTYTHAQSNLWAEASDRNGALTREPRAKVGRADVPCPKSLAISMSNTIGKMIEERRAWTGTGPIIVDGTDFLFSRERAGRQQQAVLMAGSTGKRTTTLIRLLEALDRYCKENSLSRSRLLPDLETEVKRLASE